MMELQVVSFEQAKKLEKLGFLQGSKDGYPKYYGRNGKFLKLPIDSTIVAYYAPSLDLAAKWLREEKGIPIYPEPYYPNNTLKWVCKVKYYMGKNNWSTSAFDTYEEALSAGIDKVLETL